MFLKINFANFSLIAKSFLIWVVCKLIALFSTTLETSLAPDFSTGAQSRELVSPILTDSPHSNTFVNTELYRHLWIVTYMHVRKASTGMTWVAKLNEEVPHMTDVCVPPISTYTMNFWTNRFISIWFSFIEIGSIMFNWI